MEMQTTSGLWMSIPTVPALEEVTALAFARSQAGE